jgi:hypothetical protein
MTTNIYQSAIRYIKWTENLPNGHKIYQYLPLHYPPELAQIWIFGLKMYHLATLVQKLNGEQRTCSSGINSMKFIPPPQDGKRFE